MARATLATVKRIVYDNLGVTDQGAGYGNLLANERYLSGYIDDAIAEADINLAVTLLTNKQDKLMMENMTSLACIGTTDFRANPHWFIVGVDVYIDSSGTLQKAKEVSYDEWNRLNENLGSIYDTTLRKGHYCIKDYEVLVFNNTTKTSDSTNYVLYYIDLSHPTTLTTLKCPAGFESVIANLASAKLLMKRNDNPEQAKFYMDCVTEFMQIYKIPDSNIPEPVNDQVPRP